jgi:hypothetical protein
MAQQHINLGTPPQGVDGDTNRGAWVKAEANFTDLYSFFGGDSPEDILAEIEQNTADIATMQPEVAANTSGVAANAGNITTNTGDITALKTKTDNTNTAVAANTAALALVNPVGGFKNKIINGNFDFWQRGVSNAAASALRYLADRWPAAATGSTIAQSQLTATPGQTVIPNNPVYYTRCVVASVAGAANYAQLWQTIEDARLLSSKTVTVSFWARADAAKPISVAITQAFGSGGTVTPELVTPGVLVNLTTVWQKFTVTFTLQSVAGATFGTNNNSGTILHFWMDAGSNFNGPTGGMIQQSGTFDIAQIQLEEGTHATQFEARPYAVELALCQRYYEKSYNQNAPPGSITNNGACAIAMQSFALASYLGQMTVFFKVTKRAPPTTTMYNPATGVAGQINWGALTITGPATMGNIGDSAFSWWANSPQQVQAINIQGHWTADAEL